MNFTKERNVGSIFQPTVYFMRKARQRTSYKTLTSSSQSRISYELDPSLIPAKEEKNDTHVFEVMGKVLTQKEEQIVLMHSIYEMGHKEIAEAIHMPLGSVTWAYNNAIKKLRKELEKDGYQ